MESESQHQNIGGFETISERRHGNRPDRTADEEFTGRPREASVRWYAECDTSEISQNAFLYANRRKPTDYYGIFNSIFDNFYQCGCQSSFAYTESTITTVIACW